jgi:hemin uptake protein HemP
MNKSQLIPERIVDENKDQFVIPNQSKPIYSDALFSHGDEVFIHHLGKKYLLRRTRNGKLILTK